MPSEQSEISDVMGKHTAEPSGPWCKGLFTLACNDPQIRGDVGSAVASLGHLKVVCVEFHRNKKRLY